MPTPKRLPSKSKVIWPRKTPTQDVSAKPPPLALRRTRPLPQAKPNSDNSEGLILSFLPKTPLASVAPQHFVGRSALRPAFLRTSFDHVPGTLFKQQSSRSFATSGILAKKASVKPSNFKGKEKNYELASGETAPTKDTKFSEDNDPFDLSGLEDGVARALEKLRNDISKLGRGGRFDPEAIESLRVQLVKGQKETVRLSEVAQVVPKGGRSMTVLVGDEEVGTLFPVSIDTQLTQIYEYSLSFFLQLVKSVTSAIASSDLSLNPQPDAHNPLQLNVPIPPPTKESRDRVIQIVKKAADKASMAVRDARGATHKTFKAIKGKTDEAKKAHDNMEKVARKGQDDVKRIMESAQKALERA
jgi:ribosome recycling factor